MPDIYPDLTGKKILVITKHDIIGQAMKLNLEYILHFTVQQCTLHRDNSQSIPPELLDYDPNLILVAEPADICNINDLLRRFPWLRRYENLPFLVLCVQPETQHIDSENIYYLQFPYEQDELHAKLSAILYQQDVEPIFVEESTQHPQTSVLIVEDDWIVTADLKAILEQYHYQVCGTVSKKDEVISAAIENNPDVILIDVSIQDSMDGISLAHRIQSECPTPIVFVTSYEDQSSLEKTESAHAFSHILKPFDEREVHTAVEMALYRKQVELELQQRTEELEERNAELDAFAWAVAHEIRDPINITRDFSEMLTDTDTPLVEGEIRHSLGMIRELTAGVRDTVDNLLLLATLREATVALEPVNMIEIVSRAEHRLDELKHRFNAEIIQMGPWPSAIGHSQWVEEIWVKFISTAIRFGGTPPKLTIGATKHEDEVYFWVRDNGPGINDDEKKYIFSPFLSTLRTHRYNTSLGLTVVSRIASRLGSRLSIESNPGQGNTFAFTLPIGRHSHVSMHQ